MLHRVSPLCCFLAFSIFNLYSAELPPPVITNVTVNGIQKTLEWTLYPAAQQYQVLRSVDLLAPMTPEVGNIEGNRWGGVSFGSSRFWTLKVTPMTEDELLTANLLNRIAYGPSPDDLDHVRSIGPDDYIDEQLEPESLPPILDDYTFVITNGTSFDASTNWSTVSVTGRVSSSTLYMYLTAPGEVYIDNVQLRPLIPINTPEGPSVIVGGDVLVNGDFEQSLGTGWNVAPIFSQSEIVNDRAYSGSRSLRMVSTGVGDTRESSIYQDIEPELPTANSPRCLLTFSYLPNADSDTLTLRLSGRGTIISGQDLPQEPRWIYATATGQATDTPRIYIYLNGAGEALVDNIKLVAGTNPDAGPNLVANGDFESALSGPWVPTANFVNSVIDNQYSFEGEGSLRVVATAAGSGGGNSLYQDVPVQDGQTYTVSYWYRPSDDRTLTVRLSGSELVSEPDLTLAGVKRRLDEGGAELEDLRAWFVQNAVASKRQLMQVLLQFLENHFVTQHAKSVDYLDRYYDDFSEMDKIATEWEYREIQRWTDCLLQPDCTFYDLLEISAKSPAMIVYLDTVGSLGNGNNIANENYARELFELFCNGVDSGYDQNDIVAMSRAWTGWSVDIVDAENVNNPFAPRSTTYGAYPGSGFNAVSNLVGVWTFRYIAGNHGTNRASIFSIWDPNSPGDNPVAVGSKIVPERFGAPWAGTPYQLDIPGRTGNTSINDGYDVIRHLANLPFTMEYISVKLCRLFVHDGFVHGVYDYTDPNLSEEAELIRQCMVAWWSGNPKGQIRDVLRAIFDSDLFRSHGGSLQKIKTPLEFAVSAVRALRSDNGDGSFTAGTDGYDISGTSRTASTAPLTRMGSMLLFDRADPDGYPETGPPWISAGTLAERIRFVQSLCIPVGDSGHTGDQAGLGNDAGNDTYVDPVVLLKRKLSSQVWKDPTAVANFFLQTLYPGEGLANLSQYRKSAVDFLNTSDTGTIAAFSALSDTSTEYDLRVRGMVAMLMSFQRFQEQ